MVFPVDRAALDARCACRHIVRLIRRADMQLRCAEAARELGCWLDADRARNLECASLPSEQRGREVGLDLAEHEGDVRAAVTCANV